MLRLSVFALLLTAAACGGSQNPTPSSAGSSDDAAAPAPTNAGAPVASAPVADGGVTVTVVDPSAANSGGPKLVSVEAPDECTPVGVDFEKRARPKLKECYATGKKKDPTLEGTVRIKMTIDPKGKIKTVKVVEKTLPDVVADCMLKVVKATPFPEVEKCWDASLTIPMTFPTPK